MSSTWRSIVAAVAMLALIGAFIEHGKNTADTRMDRTVEEYVDP